MIFTPMMLLLSFVYVNSYYDSQYYPLTSTVYSENDFSDTDFGHIFQFDEELTFADVYADDEDGEVKYYFNNFDLDNDWYSNTIWVTNSDKIEYFYNEPVENLWFDFGFINYIDDVNVTGQDRYVDMGLFLQCHDNGWVRDANDEIIGIDIYVQNTSLYERSNIRITPFAVFENVGYMRYVEGNYSFDFSQGNILQNERHSRILFPLDANRNCFYSLGWKIDILPEIYVNLADEQTAYQNGYEIGRNDGYNAGYDSGYGSGFVNGSTSAYSSGYDAGYDIGYDAGYDTGFDVGDIAGYNRGVDSADTYTFGRLFRSIVDTPIWFLQSLFGWSLFGEGTALISVITSLVTALLLIAIVKKVFH